MLCRWPHLVGAAICMSGTYRLEPLVDGAFDDHLYYASPTHFLPGLDGPDLERLVAQFPAVKFAGVDYSPTPGAVVPPNLLGLQFREHEGSFVVGAIAGQTSRTGVVGFVGGPIPALRANLSLMKGAAMVGVDVCQFLLFEPELARARWMPRLTVVIPGFSGSAASPAVCPVVFK